MIGAAVRIPVLAAVLLAAGCASSPFDRHFEQRRWADAAAAFAVDSALHGHPRTLYRAALVHATPGSEVYDPAMARVLLDRLLTAHVGSRSAADPAALALNALLIEMENRLATAAARHAALLAERASIAADAERLRDDIRRLEARVADEASEAEHLRAMVERLVTDLRGRETQLTEIREELARLKAIDLQRPPLRIP